MQKLKYSIILALLVLSVPASAQLHSVSGTWNLRPLDWNTNRWEFSVGALLSQPWGENLGQSYLRMSVGLIANLRDHYLQGSQLFAQLSFGWEWSLSLELTRYIRISGISHEVNFKLKNIGGKPTWSVEFFPFTVAFDIEGWLEREESFWSNPLSKPVPSDLPQLSIPALFVPNDVNVFPDQQTSIDLKALVLARLDDLLKASEQTAKENPSLDLTALRDPLTEFKKAFEANKMNDAAIQLDTFSVTLLFIQRNGLLTKFQETHLRAGLHRLVSAFALFREQAQRQKIKICTGLFVSEDQKSEEVLSPMLTDVIKKLTFTNTKTGAKETFTLKESRCF